LQEPVSPKQGEPKKKANKLGAMFEKNLKEEEDERNVVLTKSEEMLSSPDRRSLRQQKLAERFQTAVSNVVHTEEDDIKSDSASSENEEEKKQDVEEDNTQ